MTINDITWRIITRRHSINNNSLLLSILCIVLYCLYCWRLKMMFPILITWGATVKCSQMSLFLSEFKLYWCEHANLVLEYYSWKKLFALSSLKRQVLVQTLNNDNDDKFSHFCLLKCQSGAPKNILSPRVGGLFFSVTRSCQRFYREYRVTETHKPYLLLVKCAGKKYAVKRGKILSLFLR